MSNSVSLYFESALLPRGWADGVRVQLDRGVFGAIDSGVAARDGDQRAAVGLPGLPNLHSHAFQRGMAGLTEHHGHDSDSFWTWRELMYRFLAHMTPDDVEAISAQAYVEMLEAGFTRVGEFHYLHHDPSGARYTDPAEMSVRVAAAAERTGIALTLLPVFYAHGGFGGAAPTSGQRRFLSDLDSYARLVEASRTLVARLPDGQLGIAPHSLRAVTSEQLEHVVALAGEGPIHLHAAEQMREVDECVAWCGARPVEWLLDTQAIDRRWCLVHATHLDQRETERLAESGAVVGLCPITEANLGDGIFPASEYQRAGGIFGIGTDSNVLIDPAQELRALEYSQRLRLRARNLLAAPAQSTGRRLFDAALSGGSQALAAPAGIETGLPADLVALNVDLPAFASRRGDRLLDSWIFSAAHGCIDRVWRAGEQVVTNGQHHARVAVQARYRRVLERLLRA